MTGDGRRWVDRAFESVGRDDADALDRRWASVRRFIPISAFLHLGLGAVPPQGAPPATSTTFGLVAAAALCVLLGWQRPQGRMPIALATVVLLAAAVIQFPGTANHLYLHTWLAGVALVGAGEGGAQREDALTSMRWTYVIVMVWSGLQKLAHGAYFKAQYLLFLTSMKPFVRAAFAPFMEGDDVNRLASYASPGLGDGPYLADAPIIVLASNAAWIGEIVVALLVFVPRTRRVALWAGLGLILAIEIVMREFVFGLMVIYLIGVLAPARATRRAEVLVYAAFALLFAVRLAAPGWWFN